MNIERIPERLTKWAVIVAGILLAIFVGRQIGNGNFGTISLLLVGLAIGGLALAFPGKIWMVVPVTWPLLGQIPSLGLPFSVRDLMTMSVFCISLILIAFKIIRRRPVLTTLDLLIGLTIFYLIVAFVRNPVSVAAIDGDRVGGRPYFNVVIGTLAYWVLSRSALPVMGVKKFQLAFLQARVVEGVVAQILVWVPALSGFLVLYYTSPAFSWVVDPDVMEQSAPAAESTGRLGYLASIGLPLGTYVLTVYRPLSCLNPLNFGRFAGLAVAGLCILLSGFRSLLATVAIIALVSSYFHDRKTDVSRIILAGIVGCLFLALGQGTLFNLPNSMQRALSFLPGHWDAFSVAEAEDSTNWRVEMWKQMLGSNKYLDNHLLGDGFGFKRSDLERIAAKKAMGFQADQEDFMASGSVHSGPVSAIRYVGYVGLLLHICLLGFAARMAWGLLRRAKGTFLEGLVFFICVPILIEPFLYVFIFGGYENSVPDTFFAIGMLHLMKNSLDDAEEKSPAEGMDFPTLVDPNLRQGRKRQLAEI